MQETRTLREIIRDRVWTALVESRELGTVPIGVATAFVEKVADELVADLSKAGFDRVVRPPS